MSPRTCPLGGLTIGWEKDEIVISFGTTNLVLLFSSMLSCLTSRSASRFSSGNFVNLSGLNKGLFLKPAAAAESLGGFEPDASCSRQNFKASFRRSSSEMDSS